MAFTKDTFFETGGAAGRGVSPQEFSYRSATDAIAAIQAAGYFNEVRLLLSPHAIIKVIDSVPSLHLIRVVTVPATGNVTVATPKISEA